MGTAIQVGNSAEEASASTNAATRLPEVQVYGEAQQVDEQPFLPPTDGTKVYDGKKTSVIDLQEQPRIVNSNYRQALIRTPGLLVSEETTPLFSVGYRGLQPHRAQFTQVLKDGIPIHADMFGYPEAYYTPPLDSVDHVDFIHGGAALMYGPQPGGALNYVTHMPRRDTPFSFTTEHTFGSFNLYSTYNLANGTVDRLGYYVYYHHRQSNGFRDENSDFEVNSGSVKLVIDADKPSRWIFVVDAYAEEHGEPGGLANRAAFGTNAIPATARLYGADREATTRLEDEFKLERHMASLKWEHDLSEDTLIEVTSNGGYYSRYSARQRGGGFGTVPSGGNANSNTIELQEFFRAMIEGRFRHDWEGLGGTHTLAGGVMYYYTDSPRRDERGASPSADEGQLRNEADRAVHYLPIFFENRFQWGRFSLTPGFRLESIYQDVEENVNLDKTAAGTKLGKDSEYDFVPLVGLGATFQVTDGVELYGNVSQSYRPKIFTQSVPTGGVSLVPKDLEEGNAWTYEVGLRGRPMPWFWWDTSVFLIDFDNQIGTVAVFNGGVATGSNTVQNVGRSIHKGVEAGAALDLVSMIDSMQKTEWADEFGTLTVFGNVMFLDAEFESGPLEGNQPQYAPGHLIRTGGAYHWRDRVKLSMSGTIVEQHFADDGNTRTFNVPSYDVWDVTLEANLFRHNLALLCGVNNVFDQDYWARVRSDGIDPAYGRNFYLGARIALP